MLTSDECMKNLKRLECDEAREGDFGEGWTLRNI